MLDFQRFCDNYIVYFTLMLQQVEGNLMGVIPNSARTLTLTTLQLGQSAAEHSKKPSLFSSAPGGTKQA